MQHVWNSTSPSTLESKSAAAATTMDSFSLNFSAIFFTFLLFNYADAGAVGINYGLLGNNLPPPPAVVNLLHQIKVDKIRVFQPYNEVLTALHDSCISVIIGTLNQDLESLASGIPAAAAWVEANILPHRCLTITAIAVGNEVYPGPLAHLIPAAMKNLDAALAAANLPIPVTTAIEMQTLATSYPPSAGSFAGDAGQIMGEVANFLSEKKYPLLANVYPYFARAGDPEHVELAYATFGGGAAVVHDGPNAYTNLFDAMVDAVYAALEKVGAPDVEVIVSETGWPTEGGRDANVDNARAYVNNLIGHVASGQGTPRRPGRKVETYIFAMFNENMKAEGVEQHWGLHYPDLTEVYHVDKF